MAIALGACRSNGNGGTGGASSGGNSEGIAAGSTGGSTGGSSGSTPTSSQNALAAALGECHLLGSFRITSVGDNTCDDLPEMGEPVTIAADTSGPILRAGTLQLPIASAGANCTFVARGCKDTAATDNTDERYLNAELTISKTSAGIHLEAHATDVLGGRVGPCGSASDAPVAFDGQAAGGCRK